jgi:hypothetical protein
MPITVSGTSITFNDASVQTTAGGFAAGTVLLFYQAAAPTGWTQITTQNNKALRVVSGTGGGTGGTTNFTTVFTNQTPTISGSFSIGATTLSTSQIPSHTHNLQGFNVSGCGAFRLPGFPTEPFVSSNQASGAEGGGGSHTHSISGTPTSSAITLNVQYIDIILCSRN